MLSRAADLLQHCRSRSGRTAVGVLLDNDTDRGNPAAIFGATLVRTCGGTSVS